ncbi:MAG TPA: hypothetical protein VFE25_06280 [Opitutaceae bacterium]|jgi:hypothetical protein|nr:hypothetical protein [Opitutaceae bacterium]
MKRLVVLLLLATASLRASNLTMTGGWSQSLSAVNLTGGAGTNLSPSYSSAATALTATITGSPLTLFYSVSAHVAASGLPPGVTLAVTRTGDGTAIPILSAVTGGTSAVTLTSTDTVIFSGFLDRSAIPLQVTASGVSVSITPGTYMSGVVFTVSP